MRSILEEEVDLGWPPQVMGTLGALKETWKSSKPAAGLDREEAT